MPAVSVVGDVGVIWSPSHGSLRTPTDDWAGDLLSPNTSVDRWVWGGLRPAALWTIVAQPAVAKNRAHLFNAGF